MTNPQQYDPNDPNRPQQIGIDPAEHGLPELSPHGFSEPANNQGGTSGLYGLIDSVGDDEKLRPWHGVWRYDYATNRADTAVVGLNVLLALAWRLWGWIKNGGLQVASDPRQAFVDGLNAGHSRAVSEMPAEMQNLRQMAIGQMRTAESVVLRHRALIQVRADIDAFLLNIERDQLDAVTRIAAARNVRAMMSLALRDLESKVAAGKPDVPPPAA